MPSAAVLKEKQAYNDKLCKLLDDHDRAFLVHADNVGSRQFMDIRAVRHRDSFLPSFSPHHHSLVRLGNVQRPFRVWQEQQMGRCDPRGCGVASSRTLAGVASIALHLDDADVRRRLGALELLDEVP